MLETAWEKYATDLANALDDDALVAKYNEIAKENKINLSAPANIVFARDTRASGSRLVECLTAALAATGCKQRATMSDVVLLEQTTSKYWLAVEQLAQETNPDGFAQWQAAKAAVAA